jgi:hypothetical protein
MAILLALAMVILGCPSLHAEVEVRLTGGRVSIRAASAPLADVLERLARTTGMRVVYDGPVPRQMLTATLEDRAPEEAVHSVLEGLGLNYAVVMDPSGVRVDQLLILGAATAVAQRSLPTPATPQRPPRPIPDPPAADEDDEDIMDEVMDQTGEEELDEATGGEPSPAEPSAAAPAPGMVQPPPPNYPASAFTPRLPLPTPPPSATPSPLATPKQPQDQ